MTLEGLDPGRGGAEGRTLSVSMSCLLAVLFSDQVEPALCSRPLEEVGYTEVQADPGTGVARHTTIFTGKVTSRFTGKVTSRFTFIVTGKVPVPVCDRTSNE